MNYYEHHLGDYLRDTAHLSMVEDGAYRRLLDAYYIKELPLPKAVRDVYRLVRASSKVEKDAVSIVLSEFFAESADGWRHKRCDTEIARYQDKQAKAKRSAEARWGAPKSNSDGNANAMRTHSDGNAPQTPDTSNQSPDNKPIPSEANASGGKPPKLTDPKEIIFGFGLTLLMNAGTVEKHARSFLGGRVKEYEEGPVVDALRDCAKAKPLQPLEWLAAALPPKGTAKPGKHAGFEKLNYHEGVNADGSLV